MNNTNPNDPKPVYKPRKIDWDWRDAVVAEMSKRGVPATIANVAVIDLRESLDKCSAAKLSAEQTAEMLTSACATYYNKGTPYELSQ